jgi:hypothetical protein
MKLYDPTQQVRAAKITALRMMTDHDDGYYEITLDDGFQVYEPASLFKTARVGDYYVRTQPSRFNPLPHGYPMAAIVFDGMHKPALPPLAENRVPAERIEALLASVTITCQRFPGTTSTVALAALPNGFVVGQGFSACVDPASFDAAKSVQYASEDAMRKAEALLWEFEGYALMRMREQRNKGAE